MRGNPSLVFAPTEPALKHPIVDALGANRAVLLPAAAPIHVAGAGRRGAAGDAPVDPTLVPVAIPADDPRRRGPRAIPEDAALARPEDRQAGPLTVGVAVAERGRSEPAGGGSAAKHRLVLFSCPAMAENVFQEIERTNLDMLMLAAGWLRGRPDTMGIPPKHHIALTLSVDPELRQRLILVPSVVAVLSIIAMGIIVFTARRE